MTGYFFFIVLLSLAPTTSWRCSVMAGPSRANNLKAKGSNGNLNTNRILVKMPMAKQAKSGGTTTCPPYSPASVNVNSSCIATFGVAEDLNNTSIYYVVSTNGNCGTTYTPARCTRPGDIFLAWKCACGVRTQYFSSTTMTTMTANNDPDQLATFCSNNWPGSVPAMIRSDQELADALAVIVSTPYLGMIYSTSASQWFYAYTTANVTSVAATYFHWASGEPNSPATKPCVYLDANGFHTYGCGGYADALCEIRY